MTHFDITDRIQSSTQTDNGIYIYAINSRDIYCRLEWLGNACAKKARKLGYLSESALYNSSSLKDITRQARKELAGYGEFHNMEEDKAARLRLCGWMYDYVNAINE